MPTDATWFKQIDIFDGLTDLQLEMVASIAEERRCRAGEIVFDENSANDEMYIILQGGVEIQLNPSPARQSASNEPVRKITIATMGQGRVFGEIALVDQGLRSAAACCTEDDTRLLIIPRDKLMLLCSSLPDLGFQLMYNLAAELAMKMRNTDLAMRGMLYWEPGR